MAKTPRRTELTIGKLQLKLNERREILQQYLGANVDVDHYIGGILEEFERNPTLKHCDVASVFKSVRQAALAGLPLGQELCYLVPYSGRCQFQISYRGLLMLARDSGAILRHVVRSVHDGDGFTYDDGLKPWLKHSRTAANRAWENMTHVYAHFALPADQEHLEVMTREDIIKHKTQYAKAISKDSPWQTNPLSMAKKTVIRRAFAGDQIPTNQKMRQIIISDEINEVIDGSVVSETQPIDDTSPDAELLAAIDRGEEPEMTGGSELFEKHDQTS